jgi:hypothetical protein
VGFAKTSTGTPVSTSDAFTLIATLSASLSLVREDCAVELDFVMMDLYEAMKHSEMLHMVASNTKGGNSKYA